MSLSPGVCSEIFHYQNLIVLESASLGRLGGNRPVFSTLKSFLLLIRTIKAPSITDFLYSDMTGAL